MNHGDARDRLTRRDHPAQSLMLEQRLTALLSDLRRSDPGVVSDDVLRQLHTQTERLLTEAA